MIIMCVDGSIFINDKVYYMASSVRARWSYLTRSGLPAVSRKKNFPTIHIVNPLLTKLVRSRWPDIGLVLIFACLWTETESRSINSQKKKERGQYPAILTEQAWSIKDLLYGLWGNFSCGTQRAVPSEQDSSILPAQS